jgi:DNA polymerase-3 subunit delta'
MNAHHLPQAQIWVGAHHDLTLRVIDYLQTLLCPHQGCHVCSTCRGIADKQHHAINWLLPEKQYTLEDIAIIGTTLAFALEEKALHFFIIQKADALTPVCSNSLLKSIEEPPRGYHFILLTQRPHDLLPTIRSRCIEQTVATQDDLQPHQGLFNIFATDQPVAPQLFLKELEQAKINERESVDLLDQLLQHWIQKSSQALVKNDQETYKKIEKHSALLHQAVITPIMPGSSALVWKNLFLGMK